MTDELPLADGPLFCIREEEIAARARTLQRTFPGIIAYDVRTNPHPAVLRALRHGGVRAFAACNVREAAAVESGEALLFRNPYAPSAALREVVRLHPAARFSVDGLDTLERLRRATDDAVRAVSVPIGDETARVIQAAANAGLDVGVAIHPGVDDACAARNELARASTLSADIDLGVTAAGAPPAALDAALTLCSAIADEAQRLAVDPSRIRITPAAALVGAACSVITRVLLRKDDRLYLDDGRYGWLNVLGGTRWHELPPLPVHAYRVDGGRAARLTGGTIAPFRAFGPTCDSYDELEMPLLLPAGIAEGDFVEIEGVGADSVLSATHFNGFYSSRYAVIA